MWYCALYCSIFYNKNKKNSLALLRNQRSLRFRRIRLQGAICTAAYIHESRRDYYSKREARFTLKSRNANDIIIAAALIVNVHQDDRSWVRASSWNYHEPIWSDIWIDLCPFSQTKIIEQIGNNHLSQGSCSLVKLSSESNPLPLPFGLLALRSFTFFHRITPRWDEEERWVSISMGLGGRRKVRTLSIIVPSTVDRVVGRIWRKLSSCTRRRYIPRRASPLSFFPPTVFIYVRVHVNDRHEHQRGECRGGTSEKGAAPPSSTLERSFMKSGGRRWWWHQVGRNGPLGRDLSSVPMRGSARYRSAKPRPIVSSGVMSRVSRL